MDCNYCNYNNWIGCYLVWVQIDIPAWEESMIELSLEQLIVVNAMIFVIGVLVGMALQEYYRVRVW